MRLIDVDKIKLDFSGLAYIHPQDFIGTAKYFLDQIKSIPTIEAEPVRHGHWEFYAESVETMWDCKCSVCGSIEQPLQRHHYCPNCGAKMDGVE